MRQVCYGGVRLLGEGPSIANITRLDMLALPMLHYMGKQGLPVDLGHFAKMERKLTAEIERLESEIQSIAGHYVNLDSPQQVSYFLYKELGLKQPRPKLTSTGQESTDKDTLISIQHDHIAVAKILESRKMSKLRGTYVVPMPKLAKRHAFGDWRMFPKFKHTRIPTGRYAAEEPNLLAMPNRNPIGQEVCQGFIAPEGYSYLSIDFSQIEPRTIAHRSQDPRLLSIYRNNEDIYSDFATGAFKLEDKRFKDEKGWHYPGIDKKKHRHPSKICILASFYRVSAKGLLEKMPVMCENCGLDSANHGAMPCPGFKAIWNEDNCQELIHTFYSRYARITHMQNMDDARARQYGYVWDDWGRLQHTAGVKSVLKWIQSATLREAGNMPIQGFACGILKLAMAEVYDTLRITGLIEHVWPVLPIHDEILFICRNDLLEEVNDLVCEIFRNIVQLSIPIDAGGASAESWGKVIK